MTKEWCPTWRDMWMSHVGHHSFMTQKMCEWEHTWKSRVPHDVIWISHGGHDSFMTHMSEKAHTKEWCPTWRKSGVPHDVIYEWVMKDSGVSHTHERVVSHVCVLHTHERVVSDMTWYMNESCGTSLFHVWACYVALCCTAHTWKSGVRHDVLYEWIMWDTTLLCVGMLCCSVLQWQNSLMTQW